MKTCIVCGVKLKRKVDKYCCLEHQKIGVSMAAAGITTLSEYHKRLNSKIKCKCCGGEYPLPMFRRAGRNKYSLSVNDTCQICRESGATVRWTANKGGGAVKEKRAFSPIDVDKYGKVREFNVITGSLEVDAFDNCIIWEPSPTGAAVC